LLDTVGAVGGELMITFTVPALLVHPFTVTVNEYVPASAAVTPFTDGFCDEDANPFGPVHEYVAPVTAVVVRFRFAPIQIGLLLDAAGVAGIGFTTTAVVPKVPVQPFTVAVTEYVPALSAVTPLMDGFCVVELNEAGPVHVYVAPTMFDAVRFNVDPTHNGPLFVAVGAAGVALITTATVPAALVQPFTVTVKLYVPAIASVAFARVGFCADEVYPPGPVHEYVAPATGVVVNVSVVPVHTGLLLPGAGVPGIGLTTTVVVPKTLVQPLTVAVTE
jgi:hypothetical protein